MSERAGIKVYVGWEGDDYEYGAGEVSLTEIGDLATEVFGHFDGSSTPVAGVTGHLVYDPDAPNAVIYRLILERA